MEGWITWPPVNLPLQPMKSVIWRKQNKDIRGYKIPRVVCTSHNKARRALSPLVLYSSSRAGGVCGSESDLRMMRSAQLLAAVVYCLVCIYSLPVPEVKNSHRYKTAVSEYLSLFLFMQLSYIKKIRSETGHKRLSVLSLHRIWQGSFFYKPTYGPFADHSNVQSFILFNRDAEIDVWVTHAPCMSW